MKEIEKVINSLNEKGYNLKVEDRGNENISIKFDNGRGVIFSSPKNALSALILLVNA